MPACELRRQAASSGLGEAWAADTPSAADGRACRVAREHRTFTLCTARDLLKRVLEMALMCARRILIVLFGVWLTVLDRLY